MRARGFTPESTCRSLPKRTLNSDPSGWTLSSALDDNVNVFHPPTAILL